MNLFLIAHKVRGEAAFDVAEQLRCSICQGVGGYGVADFETSETTDYEGSPCVECDGLGYWWIIPTSGHRAHPYWHLDMKECCLNETGESVLYHTPDCPDPWPDHYPLRASPKAPARDIVAMLGLAPKPKVIEGLKRL